MQTKTEIRKISKSDISEMKSYAYPPTLVKLVTDCVCVLFAKKPTYENFKALIVKTDFISQLMSYDVENVSDYAINELKKFVEDPNFNVEKINSVSRCAAALAVWVRTIYMSNELNKLVSFYIISKDFFYFKITL